MENLRNFLENGSYSTDMYLKVIKETEKAFLMGFQTKKVNNFYWIPKKAIFNLKNIEENEIGLPSEYKLYSIADFMKDSNKELFTSYKKIIQPIIYRLKSEKDSKLKNEKEKKLKEFVLNRTGKEVSDNFTLKRDIIEVNYEDKVLFEGYSLYEPILVRIILKKWLDEPLINEETEYYNEYISYDFSKTKAENIADIVLNRKSKITKKELIQSILIKLKNN